MRTSIAIPVTSAFMLMASFAAAQPPRPAEPDGLAARLMAFDKNKDGKLTKEELNDERLTRLFERADANKDGAVTKDELSALSGREGAGGGGPGGGFPGGGFPGSGFPGGGFGGFRLPAPGEVLPSVMQERLGVTDAQKKELDALQKEVDAKLEKLLTDEQRKRLKEMRERGPGGFGLPGFPGGPNPGGPPRPPEEQSKEKPRDQIFSVEAVRKAVEKSLPVLLKGLKGHSDSRTCFSCHNHGTPMLAIATARDHGFQVSEKDFNEQVEFVANFLERNRERFLKGMGPGPFTEAGGETDTTGYAFLTLEFAGKASDPAIEAMVGYTLSRDRRSDHWRALAAFRPPSEASSFMTTALAIRGLLHYGLPEHKEQIAKRVADARGWLLKTPARDTEDRVFRLLGLKAVGADGDEVRKAVKELVDTQRPDGGWAQLSSMDSDAYATGSALWALHLGGGMSTDDPVYRRGLTFLLATQLEDGSWKVRTRSRQVQRYFESGFPHGKDQFISCAATGWATAALALASPPRK